MSDNEPVISSESHELPQDPWEVALKKIEDLIPPGTVPERFFDLENLPMSKVWRLSEVPPVPEISFGNGHLRITRRNFGDSDRRFYSSFMLEYRNESEGLVREMAEVTSPSPDDPKGRLRYDKLTTHGQERTGDSHNNPDTVEFVNDFLDRLGQKSQTA